MAETAVKGTIRKVSGPLVVADGMREAKTTSGRVGVKVWIYKGDILPYKTQTEDKATMEAAMAAGETSGQATRPRKIVSSAAAKGITLRAEIEKLGDTFDTVAAAVAYRDRIRAALGCRDEVLDLHDQRQQAPDIIQ